MSDSAASRSIVVGLGEVLWDVFPDGPQFGGAPANFAGAVSALSSDIDVYMVSGVGDDDLGRQALQEFELRRVHTDAVAITSHVTGAVYITLDDTGSASYRFEEDTAWDNLAWTPELQQLAMRCSAVCFGTLGQRSEKSKQTIRQFVRSMKRDSLRIFDINLRPPFFSDDIIRESLQLCNCLKLNDDELPVVAKLYDLTGTQDELIEKIASRLNLRTVAVTCGPDGAKLFHNGQLFQSEGVKTTVVDTVGAGDSFTAALTIGLLNNDPPADICRHACKVAAYVCSQPGAGTSRLMMAWGDGKAGDGENAEVVGE